MVLGEEVRGLMALARDWRFVTGDASDINVRVREIDPDARLVANELDGRLGVAVWVPIDKLGDDIEDAAGVPVKDPGGAWVFAFMVRDGAGRPYRGEPDQRVVDQMNRASTRNKREDLQKFAEFERRKQQAMVEAWESETAAIARESAERQVFGHWKSNHILQPRIFVPANLKH